MDFDCLVILESPYAGDVKKNLEYARACMRDCFMRDEIPVERALGIAAGFVWRKFADKTVVYTDLGITPGMRKGINNARELGQEIELRSLYGK